MVRPLRRIDGHIGSELQGAHSRRAGVGSMTTTWPAEYNPGPEHARQTDRTRAGDGDGVARLDPLLEDLRQALG